MKKKILITGCAGFIGFHLCKELANKYDIIGVDKISNYYSTKLKYERLSILKKIKNFKFIKLDLSKQSSIKIISKYNFHLIFHLAAQAGVRNSIYKPLDYINDNIISQINLFQIIKKKNLKKFIYASSSSVYGTTLKKSFSENDRLKQPLSLYSASKQSIEQISKYYSNYYKIPCIGIRFFTCYGPWGRPDLSVTKISNDIIYKKQITLLNYGKTKRDFTYIDDTVDGIIKCINYKFTKNNFHQIFNLGTGKTVSVLRMSKILGNLLNIKFNTKLIKHHPTDMKVTKANINKSRKLLNYKPKVQLHDGLKSFINWYKSYLKFK